MGKINFARLLKSVFGIKRGERVLILFDEPKEKKDNLLWEKRRRHAFEWQKGIISSGYPASLASYPATYSNNAGLPVSAIIHSEKTDDFSISIRDLMGSHQIVIALTEYSATAPLHEYADKLGIRAASMPGYNELMEDALNLDFKDVAGKVSQVYKKLSRAVSAEVIFQISGKYYPLTLDLRGRKPRKDDGNCRKPGTIINLPSGEAWIVPYEGEEEKSHTRGYLPIERRGKVTIYYVENNRIQRVFLQESKKRDPLEKKIKKDPCVGNIAEFAFGVLGAYGIKSCGRTLLDEKLGMHIALGRSEHLGGVISPKSFLDQKNVWHQDFVYTKEMQPRIKIKKVIFHLKDSSTEEIFREGNFLFFLASSSL